MDSFFTSHLGTAVKMRFSQIYKYIESRTRRNRKSLEHAVHVDRFKPIQTEDDVRIDLNRSNARDRIVCTYTTHSIIAKVHVKYFYWMNIFARFPLRDDAFCCSLQKSLPPRIRTDANENVCLFTNKQNVCDNKPIPLP